MSNFNLTQSQNKPKFSVAITTPGYQKLINNTLGDPNRAKRFVSSITSAVAINPALQECDSGSILAGALLGESLNLSPSPQLGQFYLVPFKSKAKYDRQGNLIEPETTKAQFILGYKGYLQLAMRSGQLRKFNAIEIKQGELKKFDPLNEVIDCIIIDDFEAREAAPTIGYYAFFELLNGFRKAIYWSKEKMLSHADKYSQAFSKDAVDIKGSGGKTYHKVSFADYETGNYSKDDEWMYSSFWYKNFDEMAKKTMLRQLISKGGCPMSAEMQQAFEQDTSVVEVDTEGNLIVAETDETPAVNQNPPITPEATDIVETVDLNGI